MTSLIAIFGKMASIRGTMQEGTSPKKLAGSTWTWSTYGFPVVGTLKKDSNSNL